MGIGLNYQNNIEWLFPKKPKIFSTGFVYGALQIIL
jgi:hypothetical protein